MNSTLPSVRGSIAGVVRIALAMAVAIALPSFSSNVSAGSTYYVGQINGSDSGPGTQTNPWRTINHAAQTMKAGDTTYVMSGTYTENVSFRNSGTASAPITLRALPGSTPIIANSTSNAITVSSKSYIVIDGLTIEGPIGKCIYVSWSSNITVKGIT